MSILVCFENFKLKYINKSFLANSLMETERFAKAAEIYGKVLAQSPQYNFEVQALCDQALAYKKIGNFLC